MSFNIAVNMFAEYDSVNKKSTTFKNYYESPIYVILRRFANQFENTVPITYTDRDEVNELSPDTVSEGARLIYAAALAAEPHAGLTMAHLYVKELFVPNHQTLQAVLGKLNAFVRICPWACVPFLNYSWSDTDNPDYPRPNDAAYKAHLYGDKNPKLPKDVPLGGSVMNISELDYRGFTYYDTNDAEDRKKYRRTRCFAATWNFIDPLNIDDRIAARQGIGSGKPVPVEDCDEFGCIRTSDEQIIFSSGNGYKCDGVSCKPSNASSFCVSSSCP